MLWNGFQVNEQNIPLPRAGVYIFRCVVNNKYYVGESRNIANRIVQHSLGRSPKKFRNSIAKYGYENFEITPIWYETQSVKDDKTFQLAVETAYIVMLDSIENGYNVLRNYHQGVYGQAWSDYLKALWTPELKERQAEITKTQFLDPKRRKKQSDSIRKYFEENPEAAKEFGEKHRKLWADPEFRNKVLTPKLSKQRSERFKTLNADPEFRAKVQEILSDPDLITRRNKSIRERLRSVDYRKAQSDRLKEIQSRPDVKARKRIAMQEVNSREEVREKHRQNTSQLIWITDESVNKRIHSGAVIPDGFRLGRVCPNGTNRPGKRWVTNGTRNLMIPRAAELPEGFRNGKFQQGAS